eukprot:Gregarina_sp_Poly_1__5351@NODE_2828_length_1665_cov_82_896120_g1783_i0_p2_GENE_NODE_2828_length_1665_cov_82_896120_g1783_i0NODE_2828_length_1665_cov_82_896120_g1783_i0_p2_ORF_typecomplete_len155_score12_83_NODE_2828_length_1665_cov_82_896120_g1783_i011311595
MNSSAIVTNKNTRVRRHQMLNLTTIIISGVLAAGLAPEQRSTCQLSGNWRKMGAHTRIPQPIQLAITPMSSGYLMQLSMINVYVGTWQWPDQGCPTEGSVLFSKATNFDANSLVIEAESNLAEKFHNFEIVPQGPHTLALQFHDEITRWVREQY